MAQSIVSFPRSAWERVKFTAPLSAITAAVVGVILNLAVFFAWHVFWPQGFEGRFDGIAALIGAGALMALFRYKAGLLLLKPWLVQQGIFFL